MDSTSTTKSPAYQQARTKTAYFQHQAPGYIKVSGEDQRSFLQRQTSNDIDLLSLGKPLVTVLTSPTGRILDVLTIIDEGESLGLITLPGRGVKTFEFLKSRIFFMDKVTLEDASSSLMQIDLVGPTAGQVIQNWGAELEDGVDEIHEININDMPVKVIPVKGFGYRLLALIEFKEELFSVLKDQNILPLNVEEFEIFRIERGIPAADHELTDEYTPLETGFQWAVSDNKGCYTGQEVLARQVNYDKITRHMLGLLLSKKANQGDALYSLENNQRVGKITSVTDSPRFGLIALAIVKRNLNNSGNKLYVGDHESGALASISDLPFQIKN